MSQLQQFSVSRKMKKTAGPAKAQLMTARINFSISVTLIFVLVKMTYINARCWQIFPEPPCFCAAFRSLYRCDPLFPRPFRLSCVQWNAAEMRGINYISVSNKWFNSSTSEVRLLLQLWARRESTCRYTCRRYFKKSNATLSCLHTVYLNLRHPIDASLPRWLTWQDPVSNYILVTFFYLKHDINLILNCFPN